MHQIEELNILDLINLALHSEHLLPLGSDKHFLDTKLLYSGLKAQFLERLLEELLERAEVLYEDVEERQTAYLKQYHFRLVWRANIVIALTAHPENDMHLAEVTTCAQLVHVVMIAVA